MKFSISTIAVLAGSAIAAPAMAPNKNDIVKPAFDDRRLALLHVLDDNKENLSLTDQEKKIFDKFMKLMNSDEDVKKRQLGTGQVDNLAHDVNEFLEETLAEAIGNGGGGLGGIPEGVEGLIGDVAGNDKRLIGTPGGPVGGVGGAVGGIVDGATKGTPVDGITHTVTGAITKRLLGAAGGAGGPLNSLTGTIGEIVDGVDVGGPNSPVNGITHGLTEAFRKRLTGVPGGPVDGVTGTVGGAVDGLTKGTPLNGATHAVDGIVGGAAKALPKRQLGGTVGGVLGSITKDGPVDNITGGTSGVLDGVTDTVDGVFTGDLLQGATGALPKRQLDAFRNPAEKITNGVDSIVKGTNGLVTDVAQGLKVDVTNSLVQRQFNPVTGIVGDVTGVGGGNFLGPVTGLDGDFTGGVASGSIKDVTGITDGLTGGAGGATGGKLGKGLLGGSLIPGVL
ncbi:hypothetical protein PT974_05408 [Cladobotryum mycophilum]|uniref:Uncharacterized protein n=1 Tax=Cladobotryum mycophilum TaxID=491253 RepID=A0ABR0SJH3_9HYPO